MDYLMESAAEGERLSRQARASVSRPRLLDAGLGPGMRVIDVGCGSGAVIPELLELVGDSGQVTGVDLSDARLDEARRLVGTDPRVTLARAALPATALPSDGWDFVWSQYVVEYFADPVPALAELVRLARPGGRVTVAEVDRAGLDFWPVPELVARGKGAFLAALAQTGFDIEAGRKVFHHFKRLGLGDVRVHASMLYLEAGRAEAHLVDDWALRFKVLAPVLERAFETPAAAARFCEAYLAMLEDEDTLKFGLVLTTSGTKP